jgi:hypothetical protein
VAQHDAPVPDSTPQPVDDPFAVAMHHDEPFAEAAPHEIEDPFAIAPSTNGKVHTNGFSTNGHTPVRFDDLFADAPPLAPAPAHDEPVAEVPASESPLLAPSAKAPIQFDVTSFDDVPVEPIAQTHEPVASENPPAAAPPIQTPPVVETPVAEAPVAAAHAAVAAPEEESQDATAGSISFSFSADEPAGSHETYDAPAVRESREIWTPPPVQPAPAPAPVAAATPAPAEPANQTQSLYYERESINAPEASRDLDEKVKNWKDSLSWREQQALSEANGTGAEKSGVIGSLLRALGVR